MVITVLRDKYNCGSNRGITYIEYPNLLGKLNQIIHWHLSTFPLKLKEKPEDPDVEDREFLGKEPELKPGNMFVYDGQVFAIDSPERIVLAVSETGALAVERFVKDIVEVELELQRGDPEYTTKDVQVTEIQKLPDELSEVEPYSLPYYKEKIWREKTKLPRMFQAIFRSGLSFLPVRIWFKGNHVYYYPDEVEPEIIEDLVQEFLCWTWKEKRDGIKMPPPEENAEQ